MIVLIMEPLIMLFGLILLFMAGIKNSRGKEGWGYVLFILGMSHLFLVGYELITNATGLAQFELLSAHAFPE